MAQAVPFNTHSVRVRGAGEQGSPESKTETSSYRTVVQQLARFARAGATLREARSQGYDMTEGDDEVFLSGGFGEPAYDLASVQEGLVALQRRREELTADIAASEERAAALQSELDAKAAEESEGPPAESE